MNAVKAKITGLFKSLYDKAFSKQMMKKEEEPVFMTLEEAKHDTHLVNEVYNQSNSAKLTRGSSNNYVAGIKYKSHQYYILGTQKEWESFFSDGYMWSVGTKMNN